MESNKQDYDEKMMKLTEYFKAMLASSITSITDHINTFKYSPTQKYSPTPPYPTTVVPDNKNSPPLDGGQSTKIGGIWTLKHEISSPKLYELLINTELKEDTALYLKNFYNHINICLNALTRLQGDIIPVYQYIKIHSEFVGYFIPYRNHPSYSWNV